MDIETLLQCNETEIIDYLCRIPHCEVYWIYLETLEREESKIRDYILCNCEYILEI